MSDAPLDGGSGWPTSAYAIIRRPDDYLSANGSAPTSPSTVGPASQPVAAAPAEETPVTPRVKLPRQKSWLRARSWSNRAPASEVTEATVNLQPATTTSDDTVWSAADVRSEPAAVGGEIGAIADVGVPVREHPGVAGQVRGGHSDESTDDAVTQAADRDAQTSDSTALPADDVDTADTTALPENADYVDDAAPQPVLLDLEAAEETRDLREAMRSMRHPDATSARGTAVVTAAGPLEEDVEPDEPNPPALVDEAGTPRALAIAAAVVIIVALALVVFFVIRGNGTRTEETATTATTAPAGAVVETDASTAVSFAPEASPAAPPKVPGAPAGDVLRSGSVRLAIGANEADESFDFDSGIKGAPNTFAGGQQPDLDALTQGLWAANGAHVAVWTKPGSPTAAECRALPDGDWTSLVKLEPALVGPKVCVQTSEGRAASFVARPIDVGPDGGVQTVYLDFTVWKKAGD
jgi:hypothetical protein